MGMNISQMSGLEIAVVGMACRFPGARNTKEFWENLCNGKESISFFTEQELLESGVLPNIFEQPHYIRARGILGDTDKFDADFFGINPSEAEIIDPQQRLFLECAWQAIEDAGYNPHRYDRPIGLFGGSYENSYQTRIYSRSDLSEKLGDFLIRISNEKDYLTTRVAYHLRLTGPAVTVQTACSTSLVAVHLAAQSLLNGSCDMALAGGVTIKADEKTGYFYEEAGTLSHDGHCRPFDSQAHGFVSSNGVGVIVMKRLEDALKDNDTIYGVIKGSAINNDGADKVGFTAPSVSGQVDVISSALAIAEVNPDSISFVEAHGSATLLGDPIEVKALEEVFNSYTSRRNFCAIGSVKGNIGHTHVAAGIAGLIKTLLALKYKIIPPSINYSKPNPNIDFENSPFYVNTEKKEWETKETPRRAGVSAFGIGGTNAHVVLEEALDIETPSSPRPWHLITMSTKSEAALENITSNLTERFRINKEIDLADAAYTLGTGRKSFEHRRILVCKDREDLLTAMNEPNRTRLLTSHSPSERSSVIFMFPGLGDHYLNMGFEYYQYEPVFRNIIDNCSEILRSLIGRDIREVIYARPMESEEALRQKQTQGASLSQLFSNTTGHGDEWGELFRTSLAQPAVFITEYALARLWMSWGINPQALIGYSVGEYVSACLAGVLSLEDALFLIANRAQLIENLPGGGMLAVLLPQDEITPFLKSNLSLAGINSPSICTVAGPNEEIASLQNELSDKGIAYRQLRTTHAFHSKMMRPIMQKSADLVGKISLRPPKIPYVSTVTGDWVREKDATDPDYWARHMCEPVNFLGGIKKILESGERVLIEVGPGQSLASLSAPHVIGNLEGKSSVISTMKNRLEQKSDYESLISALGKLWLLGFQLDFAKIYNNENRKRISLPSYEFDRKRYWLSSTSKQDSQSHFSHTNSKRNIIDDWFYIPTWKQSIQKRAAFSKSNLKTGWLVFMDEIGFGDDVLQQIHKNGNFVFGVSMGNRFRKLPNSRYILNPKNFDDYVTVLRDFSKLQVDNWTIVYLWPLSYPTGKIATSDFPGDIDICFHNLTRLAKAVSLLNFKSTIKILLVSNNTFAVTGSEILSPEKSLLLGPAKVLPQELPSVQCAILDLDLSQNTLRNRENMIRGLVDELLGELEDSQVAVRGKKRWTREYESIQLQNTDQVPAILKHQGVYLITGGQGALGLKTADYLAKTVKAKLILIGRTMMPMKRDWEKWLETHPPQDKVSVKIKTLNHITELGGEFLLLSADITNPVEIKRAISRAKRRFGRINGVIHAAGLPGHGMMQLKEDKEANDVLAPKTYGTLMLYENLMRSGIDFLVLFSSTFSITGGFGQSDYVAANAFLDAYAHYAASSLPIPYTVSINWDAWKNMGIAYNNLAAKSIDVVQNDEKRNDSSAIFARSFNPLKDWLIDEHRMLGKAMLPGTGYLEIIRDIINAKRKNIGQVIEFHNVTFLSPVVFNEGEDKEITTRLRQISQDEYEFSCLSILNKFDHRENQRQENVIGKVLYSTQQARKKQHDIKKIIERYNLKKLDKKQLIHHGPMQFGPRSLCLKRIYVGKTCALAMLKLDSKYIKDLEIIKLHPSLLDIATGFVNLYLNQDTFYMPLSYGKIKIYQDIPSQIISYVKYLEKPITWHQETLSFDITILDQVGFEILVIEDFTMKRVDNLANKLTEWSKPGVNRQNRLHGEVEYADPNNIFRQHYESGLLPDEGIEAFSRILAHGISPQVIVATKDFDVMRQEIDAFTFSTFNQNQATRSSNRTLHSRPNLPTPYIAPRSPIEKTLAEIWKDLLGIQEIGIEDSFFDLGGHSLLGVQLVAKLRSVFDVDLPLRLVFEHPTIATLAVNISKFSRRVGGTNEY